MRDFVNRIKRLLIDRSVLSGALGETFLSKRIILPVFAPDALSSVGYAPDEVLITLAVADVAATSLPPWMALAVVDVLAVVVVSYRQIIHAYPSGGGDYEMVSTNLGSHAGPLVASALLSGYILTVAVSISSGTFYLVVALPALVPYRVKIAVAVVTILAVLNMCSSHKSGRVLAIPTCLYMSVIGIMAVVGLVQEPTGTLGRVESASFDVVTHVGWEQGLVGLVGDFLALRAFSSGCVALTGVEVTSNDAPSLQRPKSHNAATTLLFPRVTAALMPMSVIHLVGAAGVHMVEGPAHQLLHNNVPVGDGYHQDPAIGQIVATVFPGFRLIFYPVATVAGLILILAINTAFNGFPVLVGVLARDEFLSRQLSQCDDRLAFSNGIIVLWLRVVVFLIDSKANTTRLIQPYIVGVFIFFSLSQVGMVCHWIHELTIATEPRDRSRIYCARIINFIDVLGAGTVLVIVLLTKFTRGAWITLTIMALLYLVMNRICRHYCKVSEEVVISDLRDAHILPTHVHAIILASRLHQPTLWALAYARSTHPTILEALTVDTGDSDVERLLDAWEGTGTAVPLTVLDSFYRGITRPVTNCVRSVRRESLRDLIVVFLPEYIVRHWWEQIPHSQTALHLKAVLLFTPGVAVVFVPWQLGLPKQQHIHHGVRARTTEGIIDVDVAMRRHVDSHLSHPDQHSPTGTSGASADPQENR